MNDLETLREDLIAAPSDFSARLAVYTDWLMSKPLTLNIKQQGTELFCTAVGSLKEV